MFYGFRFSLVSDQCTFAPPNVRPVAFGSLSRQLHESQCIGDAVSEPPGMSKRSVHVCPPARVFHTAMDNPADKGRVKTFQLFRDNAGVEVRNVSHKAQLVDVSLAQKHRCACWIPRAIPAAPSRLRANFLRTLSTAVFSSGTAVDNMAIEVILAPAMVISLYLKFLPLFRNYTFGEKFLWILLCRFFL